MNGRSDWLVQVVLDYRTWAEAVEDFCSFIVFLLALCYRSYLNVPFWQEHSTLFWNSFRPRFWFSDVCLSGTALRSGGVGPSNGRPMAPCLYGILCGDVSRNLTPNFISGIGLWSLYGPSDWNIFGPTK